MNDVSKNYIGQIAYLREGKSHGVIEYEDNGEPKSILFLRNMKEQVAFKKQNLQKDVHQFRSGDIVKFQIKHSEKDITKSIAYNVFYLRNEALDNLLNLAAISNKFFGFLKKIEEDYFVKEVQTYLFIPVDFSKWEHLPSDDLVNTKVSFKLINQQKINKLSAKLLDATYRDEIQVIKSYLDKQDPIAATITKLNPNSIAVDLLNGQFKGKLPLSDNLENVKCEVGEEVIVRIENIDKNVIEVRRL